MIQDDKLPLRRILQNASLMRTEGGRKSALVTVYTISSLLCSRESQTPPSFSDEARQSEVRLRNPRSICVAELLVIGRSLPKRLFDRLFLLRIEFLLEVAGQGFVCACLWGKRQLRTMIDRLQRHVSCALPACSD